MNFPNPPLTVGQQFSAPNGALYLWDGTAWTPSGFPLSLPLGGDLGGALPAPTVTGFGGGGVLRARDTPLMLAAVNGAVSLTGTAPTLTRVGANVFLSYQGTNKASTTANTISLAEIPVGYRPPATVSQSITTPAITMSVGLFTSGTNVFPDAPGTNVTTGITRWALRHGTQFAASAAISLAMQWQTSDP